MGWNVQGSAVVDVDMDVTEDDLVSEIPPDISLEPHGRYNRRFHLLEWVSGIDIMKLISDIHAIQDIFRMTDRSIRIDVLGPIAFLQIVSQYMVFAYPLVVNIIPMEDQGVVQIEDVMIHVTYSIH